jgi:serine/threonine protein kinase/formylglycine-generating enzyme required for sulfatase activity
MSEEAIFAAALDMRPAERADYLDRACGGDAVLRQRLERMLAAGDRAGNFMARPAVADSSESGTEILDANSTPNDVTVTRAGQDQARAEDDEVPLGFLAPPTRPDSLGRIGHYEVLEVLGQGGFGIVFRAFDDTLQRVVAVKVLAPQLAATSPARKRFLREARTSAAVRHEHVVQVYEVGETPLPYIAMEFIPGETLQQRLDRTGPVEPAEVVRVGRQVAEGLAAAHATDLIHRDIKPGNILLEGGQQRVKITDFGLARAADDASISQSGIIAGTPMYMAPEQALGHKLDQRADLFSLGSVLYQMAAGRPPFRANGTVAVLKRVAEDTPRDIREITPETPQWLCAIIAKLHAKDPDKRYQSAREVADVLADCEAQLKAGSKLKDYSRIPKRMQTAVRKPGRRKWAAAVVLFSLITLTVMEFAGVTHLFRRQSSPGAADPNHGLPPGQQVNPDAGHSEGWVQLFNGKDLTGWKTHPDQPGRWTVENGILRGSAVPSYLYSDRGDFANFHLRVEARINRGGDSGLFFRAPFATRPGRTADQRRPAAGYEVELSDVPTNTARTGSVWDAETTGPPKLLQQGSPDAPFGPDEWLTVEVIARDNHFVATINGTPVADCMDARNRYASGHLALQVYSPRTVVEVRKIEIKELPSNPPAFKNSLGMEFVRVPKGKAWLGGGKDKLGDREVEIKDDFYLGKYEVTQEEWEKVMGENPSYFSRTGGAKDAVKDIPDADLKRFPVENVSWDQCQVFVAKLNQREKEAGWVYRLPTEKEWEYACRGGPMVDKADSAFDYYFAKPTNTLLPDQANFKHDKGLKRTRKVGSYEPNVLGLADMHGSLAEWCDDAEKGANGVSLRGFRGGCWTHDSGWCRAVARNAYSPSSRGQNLGLRLARVPADAASPDVKTPLLAATVLKDAVLLMNFEKDTFYAKDGKTYVRDLSGRGNDGLCENVAFTADGKVGGSLLCEHGPVKATDSAAQDYAGGLRIGKSLITGQSNYTITAWCRKVSAGPANLYLTCRTPGGAPDTRSSHFVVANYREGRIAVEAYNPGLGGEKWRRSSTDKETIPEKGWFFVAASLSDGVADGGKLRVFINDRQYSFNSQLAESNPSDKDLVDLIGCNTSGAVIDELAVFQRALSDEEIAAVRALGLKGTPLNVGKAPPAVAPFTDADAQRIAGLPPAEQVEEVRKELMRRNPGFDRKLEHKIVGEAVTELHVLTDEVTNIAPVRALKGLVYLDLRGTYPYQGKLSDLSPLKGMTFTRLDCSSTRVADLTPLADLPLAFLHFNHNPVSTLAPLKDMPLVELGCAETRVTDFSPLKGMQLQKLGAQLLAVTDLTPLQGMPLKGLDLYHTTGVTSIAPLQGMPLEGLNLQDVPVADVSPLKGMTTLRSLTLAGNALADLGPLAGLKLTDLAIREKRVSDLAPLKGMPLVRLEIHATGVTDLRPLQGMPLQEIRLTPKNITQGLEILRDMKSLKTIGIGPEKDKVWPAAEFWERHDKGEFK